MIKIFEEFKRPDLRKVNFFYVKCIKNYPNLFSIGEGYKIIHMYGDPQRAIEEFGINDFMPLECVSNIELRGNDGKEYLFTVNKGYYNNQYSLKSSGNFYDYFDLMTEEECRVYKDAEKYNL